MTSASVESSLEILSFVFGLTAASRVAYCKLIGRHSLFFAFLCINIILNGFDIFFGNTSRQYFYAYIILEPLINISYILVVWELFSSVFRNYAGLRSLSRWVMGVAAVIAPVGLVLAILAPGSTIFSKITLKVIRFERGVTFSLVIFILILLYFISKYPIKLPRNIVALCMLYSIWFMGDSAMLLASSLLPMDASHVYIVNDGLALFQIASYIGWAFLLSRAGEYQETRIRHNLSREREEALIGELDALNQVLLRASHSVSPGRPSRA